jgi:hypothetical protein
MDDTNRQDAIKEHDRSREYQKATDEAVIKGGEVAIRTVMLINGGAAVAVLAFIGALVREGGVSVKQIAGVSTSLLWFGGGVAAAAWALGLAYCTNYCYGREAGSKVFTWQHPYIVDGVTTPSWRLRAWRFHAGAAVWGVLALVAFIFGMIGVWNGIVRL